MTASNARNVMILSQFGQDQPGFAVADIMLCLYNICAYAIRQEGRYHKLATRYPSDYDNHSRVQPGISREGRSGASSRGNSGRAGYSSQRTASRGSAQRTGQRTAAGQRPGYSGQRPSPNRRPAQRPPQRSGGHPRKGGRGRRPNRFPAFAALAAVLVVVLVLLIAKPFGHKKDPVTNGQAVPASNPIEQTVSNPDTASNVLLQGNDGEEDEAPQKLPDHG